MADERLLDYCAASGMKQWFSTDEDGNSFVRYEQDINGVLDFCKRQQNEELDRKALLRHAGFIPDIIAMKWMTEHGVNYLNPDHQDGVKRLLNDSDYRFIRSNTFTI